MTTLGAASFSLAVRDQLLLALAGGRSDRLASVADDFEQNVVNKRLRVNESVVDATQPSLAKVAKAVLAACADPNDENCEVALREITRFEMGPVRNCTLAVETGFRETVEYKKQLEQAVKEREADLVDIVRLKKELELARTLPKKEVELVAEECNKLPSQLETNRKREELLAELDKLKQQREELKRVVELRRKGVQEVAQAMEKFRQTLENDN